MIIEELLENGLVKYYSDSDMQLFQVETGIEYQEAIDKYPSSYTYTESKNKCE